MSIPEGVQTVTAEGRDLYSAIAAAAESLEVPAGRVGYDLDLSFFRGAGGNSIPRDHVRIIAYAREGGAEPAAAPVAAPARDASEPDEPRRPAGLRGAEEGTTEASEFATQWFVTLLEHMNVTGTVRGTGAEGRVHLHVEAERAGRIIGKRGATLGAIRHLLRLALERFDNPVIDVDVADPRDSDRGDRRSRRRDDDDRRGRGRDRDRRGRDRDDRRGRNRDDRRGRSRDRDRRGRDRDDRREGSIPEEKLRELARRAAHKARETGKTITVNLELNSYDRRLVHLEVAEIEGVSTQSQVRDGVKYVQVIPAT